MISPMTNAVDFQAVKPRRGYHTERAVLYEVTSMSQARGLSTTGECKHDTQLICFEMKMRIL